MSEQLPYHGLEGQLDSQQTSSKIQRTSYWYLVAGGTSLLLAGAAVCFTKYITPLYDGLNLDDLLRNTPFYLHEITRKEYYIERTMDIFLKVWGIGATLTGSYCTVRGVHSLTKSQS